MTYCVLVKDQTASMNVDSYNRTARAGSAVDISNGNVFRLDTINSSGSGAEVWTVSAPTLSGSTMDKLWMAGEADTVVTTVSGTLKYRGLNQDPRNFYIPGGDVFNAFKPQIGDIITITADGFTGTAALAYANSTDGAYTFTTSASVQANSLTLKYLATTYISIGTGNIGSHRVTAYQYVVHNN
jgi:hypothetical protein